VVITSLITRAVVRDSGGAPSPYQPASHKPHFRRPIFLKRMREIMSDPEIAISPLCREIIRGLDSSRHLSRRDRNAPVLGGLAGGSVHLQRINF